MISRTNIAFSDAKIVPPSEFIRGTRPHQKPIASNVAMYWRRTRRPVPTQMIFGRFKESFIMYDADTRDVQDHQRRKDPGVRVVAEDHKLNLRSSEERKGHSLASGLNPPQQMSRSMPKRLATGAVGRGIESARGFLASGPAMQAGPMTSREKSVGGHRPPGKP